MARLSPVRIPKWLGLAYAAAITLFLFYGADAPDVVIDTFFILPWLLGPAVAAAVCVKASRTTLGAWCFLVLEAALIASTAAGWYYLIYVTPHSTNGIAMLITIPFGQYAGSALFFALACACGWRARRAFLEA